MVFFSVLLYRSPFNGNDLDNLINSLGIETLKPIDVNNDLLV